MPKSEKNPRGCSWDVRWTPVVGEDYEYKEEDFPEKPIIAWARQHCKKYAFQLEKGEKKGGIHWQARFSMKKAVTKNYMVGQFLTTFNEKGLSWYISPTSCQNMGNEWYVTKEETRLKGPFTDKTVGPWIQAKVKKIVEADSLKPWQQRLVKMLLDEQKDTDEDRKINLKIDPGERGKSLVKRVMKFYHGAILMPPSMETPQQMMQFICSNGNVKEHTKPIILMDVPKAVKGKHWWTLAQGLEEIKQGCLYDTRFHCQEKNIEPPVIMAFGNNMPPAEVLTKGVFKMFYENEDGPDEWD